MKIGGLDLSSKEKNPSGVCIYRKLCTTAYTDEEIINALKGADILAVDAPLSLSVPWRDSERELISRGFRPLPLSMKSMRLLYERARRIISKLGVPVIETFVSPMRTELSHFYARKCGLNRHERDALLCAIAAKAYIEGSAVAFGREHPIYVAPKEYVDEELRRLLRTSCP